MATTLDAVIDRDELAIGMLDASPEEPTDADLAEYREWTCEADAREFLDVSERLTLAELVDRQVAFYRGWDNPAGEMIARALEELALKVRMTDATTPDEFEARVEILDAQVRADWEAIGYEEGRDSCRRDQAGSAFGHMA